MDSLWAIDIHIKHFYDTILYYILYTKGHFQNLVQDLKSIQTKLIKMHSGIVNELKIFIIFEAVNFVHKFIKITIHQQCYPSDISQDSRFQYFDIIIHPHLSV